MTVTTRKVRFTAAYENGEERERVLELDLDDALDGDELDDVLWEYTGFGPEFANLSAFYAAESVDGLAPVIDSEWG